jgi:DNA-binding SARP family transcriptional activator
VWVGCEPGDDAADHLLEALEAALDLPGPVDVARVCDAVWAEAPGEVCLVFDDVHEIPRTSSGATTLRQLVEELPANGHVVLSSRDAVPIPTARLASSDQLVRIREPDLVFGEEELRAFARLRDVDAAVLASSGGWPALAELTASAGEDLVVEYLWDEVLERLGPERSALLARLAVAGGGDDAIASAVAGERVAVGDVVGGVPLVQRTADGAAALHPLWIPPLLRLLTPAAADEARQAAARAHRAAGRLDAAVGLFVESGDWDGVLDVMRDGILQVELPHGLIRWSESLPADRRDAPVAVFAAAIDSRNRNSAKSVPRLAAATAAFRAAGDVDGEIVAIHHEGLARWQANDFGGLFDLIGRVTQLVATGSRRAEALDALGHAVVSHALGDSAGVFAALGRLGDDVPRGWILSVAWFEAVAHRRNGDLDRAYATIDRVAPPGVDIGDSQFEVARIRTDWLRGEVDHAASQLAEIARTYQGSDRFLFVEASLELAAKAGFLGDVATAGSALAAVGPLGSDAGVVARVLDVIARVAVAVNSGDEALAATILRESPESIPGRPECWYWRDRAALALPYVLLPEARDAWAAEPRGAAHELGFPLAPALVAARAGDRDFVRALSWPSAGIVRANLPLAWAVELALHGRAAGNPPPADLVRAIGPAAREPLRRVADRTSSGRLQRAARSLLDQLPLTPSATLRLGVLGPVAVWRGDTPVEHAHLRRARVRALLCLMVARRRARREELAEELWPDLDDPGRNLRTTLSYLQQVLEPDRAASEPAYFLRPEGSWLTLVDDEYLAVDAWQLDSYLDAADAAERGGKPAAALDAYRAALPLWRGEPYADVLDGTWAHAERARLAARYTTSAVRAGDLLLASGEPTAARAAAERALAADATAEPAYRLLARTHRAEGNPAGAARALEACRAALEPLGLRPAEDVWSDSR